MNKTIVDNVDALLPQTQCGLCGYGACRPYAAAIVCDNEEINKCPPGGVNTLLALGKLLNKDVEPLVKTMEQHNNPPKVATIREEECIGCTKCIQACPVDAIMGASKQMHSIISSECTGCELCVLPCPVDCIDMVETSGLSEKAQLAKADVLRQRFQLRTQRLKNEKEEQARQYQKAKLENLASKKNIISARNSAIQEAILRVKAKKRDQQHEP